MIINENWEIKSDLDQIILIEKRPSSKDKNKETIRQTYHPNAHAVLKWIVKKEVNITGLEDLKSLCDCVDRLYNLIDSLKIITIEKIVYKKVKDEEDEENV